MSEQHPRGVYEPKFKGPGHQPLLLAVDGEGRLVAHVSITDPDRRGAVVDRFRDLLDAIDPSATLRLIR